MTQSSSKTDDGVSIGDRVRLVPNALRIAATLSRSWPHCIANCTHKKAPDEAGAFELLVSQGSVLRDHRAAKEIVDPNPDGVELMVEVEIGSSAREIHRVGERHVGAAEVDVKIFVLQQRQHGPPAPPGPPSHGRHRRESERRGSGCRR
jgi:hypothetical protein